MSGGDPSGDALRRTLRDMVALSVLPAVWGQFEPRQLAASLAQVLRDTLIIPIVYVRLDASGEELASTHRPCTSDEVANIGRAFAGTSGEKVVTLPNPLGGGTLRCARVPIAWRGGQWTLVAAGVEATFPTLEERMLLTAAANHAAVALERATAFRALRESEQRAETANRDKDEFLANVSHEIRTPMNAILGMTELTLETALSDEQRGWLTTVKAAGEHLLVIIDSLLDFSKVGASKVQLDLAELSLRDQLASVVRGSVARAYKKQLELVLDVADDVPDRVIGDAGRLRQVLINLVENAIKFTHEGHVILEVSVGRSDGSEVELAFAVRDTGIGIPAHQHHEIFEAFTQADSSTTRKYGGTGLGLTIASQLAALMDGSIDVISEPGTGSTFTLRARFRRVEVPADVPVRWPGIRVLVVNHDTVASDVIARWLRGWGMEVDVVHDGGTAADLLMRAIGSRKYELVVIDGNAPGVARESAESKTPLADPRAARILRLGATPSEVKLHKPLIKEELANVVARLLGADPPARPVPAEAAPATRALRVLVGEDNEFNAIFINELLRRKGHQARVVRDGTGVLSELESQDYDLLLLDLHMPGLDGFQVIREIRAREQVKGGHLSVIALTARSRDQDREICIAAGMDGFVPKPINTAALWAAVNAIRPL